MATYRLLGKPLSPLAPELTDHRIGEEFERELSPEREKHLIAMGCIVPVEDRAKKGHKVGATPDGHKVG